MTDTNEAAKPQKWTERNAAALALVDRLPDDVQNGVMVGTRGRIYVTGRPAPASLRQFLTEFAPDAETSYTRPDGYGWQDCHIEFADGVVLQWSRKVRTVVIPDEE